MNAADSIEHQGDLAAAPSKTLSALAQHLERIRAERMPTDSPFDQASLIRSLQHSDPDRDQHYFFIWRGGDIIARASVTLPLIQNETLAELALSVLSPYRRQGLARQLLGEIARLMAQHGRSRLHVATSDQISASEAVLNQLGAVLVMRQQFMELDLRTLDVQQLTTLAAGPSPDLYSLWTLLGWYPEERLEDIGRLRAVMHTAPQGTRQREEQQPTPAQLRAEEERFKADGHQRLTTFAESRRSGELVAFTELVWDDQRPSVMIQQATAVRPDHRKQALGRRIKAVNLQAVASVNPEARWVRAGNTDDNTGMLKINEQLGFRPYTVHTDWQLDLNVLQRYLAPDSSGDLLEPVDDPFKAY